MSSERLEDHEWLPIAQTLPTGGRTRVAHECGEGSPLLITREQGKFTAYCFRCGGTGFHAEQESLTEKLERIQLEQQAEERVRYSVELPEPRAYDTRQWPLADKVWFFKQGFSLSMMDELGLYWCPDLGRVVLPITRDDHVVYWQARSQKRAPKWMTPHIPKHGLTARYGVGKGDLIVLTEDALSAYKVGLVTEAWSLLGTKLHPKVLDELARSGKRVATWLDDDRGRRNGSNPGQKAAAQIGARLRAFGIEHHNITSDRDPKYYNADDIRRMLCTATSATEKRSG